MSTPSPPAGPSASELHPRLRQRALVPGASGTSVYIDAGYEALAEQMSTQVAELIQTVENLPAPISEMLISTDTDNIATLGTDDGIYVPPDQMVVSADTGNMARLGTDDGIFVPTVSSTGASAGYLSVLTIGVTTATKGTDVPIPWSDTTPAQANGWTFATTTVTCQMAGKYKLTAVVGVENLSTTLNANQIAFNIRQSRAGTRISQGVMTGNARSGSTGLETYEATTVELMVDARAGDTFQVVVNSTDQTVQIYRATLNIVPVGGTKGADSTVPGPPGADGVGAFLSGYLNAIELSTGQAVAPGQPLYVPYRLGLGPSKSTGWSIVGGVPTCNLAGRYHITAITGVLNQTATVEKAVEHNICQVRSGSIIDISYGYDSVPAGTSADPAAVDLVGAGVFDFQVGDIIDVIVTPETANLLLYFSTLTVIPVGGAKGDPGVSNVPGPPGSTGPTGPTGPPGATGGQGLPTGGLPGQILGKNSSTNYDTAWLSPTGIDSGWHYANGPGEPKIANTVGLWDGSGVTFSPFRFRRDGAGCVFVEALTQAPSAVSTTVPVFTFPVGFRPAYVMYFVTVANGGPGQWKLQPDGQLFYIAGPVASANFLATDGMTWMAEDIPGQALTWNPLTLQGTWANFASGTAPARYYIDNVGDVHLSGTIRGGALGAVAQLPAGAYDTQGTLMFCQSAGGPAVGTVRVDVNAGGGIVVSAYMGGGTNSLVSLDGIVIANPGGVWPQPTLVNSWVNYGGGYTGCQVSVNKNGVVSMRGLVAGGAVANLSNIGFPTHAIPRYEKLFLQAAAAGTARVDVNPAGAIIHNGYMNGGSNGYLATVGRWFATAEGPGLTGSQGPAGPPGATGGQGLPVGGTTGQILTKNSPTDYDTRWGSSTAKDYLSAHRGAAQALSAAAFNTIVYEVVDANLSANGDISYNTGSGIFTINNTGIYQLTAGLLCPAAGSNLLLAWMNSVQGQLLSWQGALIYSNNGYSIAGAVYLVAGSKLSVQAYVSAAWTIPAWGSPNFITQASVARIS